ncbi:MAG TPA: SDR family NAD(P)-dependent oxidoreductase [Verrucomicrobiae bacterium]|jgi:NAD(P)-dependent dehydrogenase (short-subunit alcohol dehydrogenase family)|nr:SDR family NAD(P)-dependent oxidoreductase [Verrucomicrobiae bacterium]
MSGRLGGKVAIITGAAHGQGRIAAETFAREGARLVLSDMDAAGLEETVDLARALGAEVAVHTGDLTGEEANRELTALAVRQYGKLDVMYNNAGRIRFAPIHEATVEDWEFNLANELTIVFLGCKQALRAMLPAGAGCIINVASRSGLFGVAGHGAHAATKAGVIGLTRQIAVEYGPKGIRCNAIAPSYIDYGEKQPRMRANAVDSYPLGRFAQPQDPVNAALFLASDEASFITGQVIVVDGGRSAR